MVKKPTYEELEQRIRELEKKLTGYKSSEGNLPIQFHEPKAVSDQLQTTIYIPHIYCNLGMLHVMASSPQFHHQKKANILTPPAESYMYIIPWLNHV